MEDIMAALPAKFTIDHTRVTAACTPSDALLEAAEARPDERLLVIGGPHAELLCAALRRGCCSALCIATPQRCSEPADLVLVPRVGTPEEAQSAAACARRALASGATRGRLVMGFAGAGALAICCKAARGLRAYGFTRARLRARAEGGVLVCCEFSAATQRRR
jgi:hypothetical protein